jgi:hypothetical protein
VAGPALREGCLPRCRAQEPPRRGIILAVVEGREQAEEIAAGDPFSTGGVCTYRITEFAATKTAPALDGYREPLG